MTPFNEKKSDWVILVLFFLLLGFFYLYPGSILLFSGSKTQVLSDGTDPTTLPYQYSQIADLVRHDFSHLFYGALPSQAVNAPEGMALWLPWSEKWLAAILSFFVPIEQISAALTLILMVFTALCFYIFGRNLYWPRWISLGLAVAWGFNAYTLARARVHMGLVSLYYLPVMFLALLLLQRCKNWRDLWLPTLLFLLAGMTTYYHLVMVLPFIPFLLWYYYRPFEVRRQFRKSTLFLITAAMPTFLFFAWSVLKPFPTQMLVKDAAVMPSTVSEVEKIHPFMKRFDAHLIDYFAGNVGVGLKDWNPARYAITKWVYEHLEDSSYHERAHSVRWVIWIFFIWALVWMIKPSQRKNIPAELKQNLLIFIAMAFFAIWMSIGVYSPSTLVHLLIPYYRVPNRVSTIAHFAMLVSVGYWLNFLTNPQAYITDKKILREFKTPKKVSKWLKKIPALFVILVIIDLPPMLNSMPVAIVAPKIAAQTQQDFSNCGAGFYFPYVSYDHELLPYYNFLQVMRETSCQILNAGAKKASNLAFMRRFGYSEKIFTDIKNDLPIIKNSLVQFVRCMPLEWIYFDAKISETWIVEMCTSLGWEKISSHFCRARKDAREPMKRMPMECLQ